MIICLEQGADLHRAQLMSVPFTVCFCVSNYFVLVSIYTEVTLITFVFVCTIQQ